jgi:hypothetical protein
VSVLRVGRDDPGFSRRSGARIGDERFEGLWQLARTPGDGQDDLPIAFRRAR